MPITPSQATASTTPLISLIGWSNSGKTTFLEKVVAALSQRGIRVGIIKHHGHASTVDVEGKDTWRYEQAGASPVIVSSSAEYAIIRKAQREHTLAELAGLIGDECDIMLTEGFRKQANHIVEFMREDHNAERIFANSDIVALITDSEDERARANADGLPVFALDDVDAFTDFLADICAKGACR